MQYAEIENNFKNLLTKACRSDILIKLSLAAAILSEDFLTIMRTLKIEQ
ncbi:MAG: hypothetical protein FWD48_10345 [Oscillospiraceae bacterium]|nr:hypothetical protein [Oscillospiraceae bacterium]